MNDIQTLLQYAYSIQFDRSAIFLCRCLCLDQTCSAKLKMPVSRGAKFGVPWRGSTVRQSPSALQRPCPSLRCATGGVTVERNRQRPSLVLQMRWVFQENRVDDIQT